MLAYSATAFFRLPSFEFIFKIEREDTCFILEDIGSQILGPIMGDRFASIKVTINMWDFKLRCLTKIVVIISS